MANEFDNNQYTDSEAENQQPETAENNLQDSAAEQTAGSEQPNEPNQTGEPQIHDTQSAGFYSTSGEQPNFVPYQDYVEAQPQNDQSTDYNPYAKQPDDNQQAHNEPFSYSPYPDSQNDSNKFTPIDYSQMGQNGVGGNTKTKGRGPVIFLVILVVVFALAAASFAGIYFSNRSSSNAQGEEAVANSGPSLTINSKPATDDETDSEASGEALTVTQIAKQVRPSVVGIIAYTAQSSIANFGESSTASSSGSGVIMSSDGYIITNAHVIEGADRVSVVLENEAEYEADIIGSDSKTDLAVIKIDETNLNAAEFGDSSETEVGEDVIAIGNPAGLELAGSITRGIVSAVERPIQSSSSAYTMNCIQTDAAINPGNSGGALVNMYGQVIGINSSKIADVDYEGIGFAISSNDVQPIVDDLVKYGYVKDRARLGITYQEMSSTYAAYYGVPAGLYVTEVDESVNAYAQGLRAGDIITKIDGTEITDSEVVIDYLKEKSPGDKVKLTVYRYSATGNGKTFSLSVTLAEDKGDDATSTASDSNDQNGGGFYGNDGDQGGSNGGYLY